MHEAKTHLSRLVKDVAEGREAEVIITNGRVPAAKIVPFETVPAHRIGFDQGLFIVPDDFNEPDPEIEALFYGEE